MCREWFQFLFLILDEEILNELLPWKENYDKVSHQKIIDLNFTLDSSDCYTSECVMGDFLADVFLESSHNKYKSKRNEIVKAVVTRKVSIAFVQAGGIRTTLPKGCKFKWILLHCIKNVTKKMYKSLRNAKIFEKIFVVFVRFSQQFHLVI